MEQRVLLLPDQRPDRGQECDKHLVYLMIGLSAIHDHVMLLNSALEHTDGCCDSVQ